MKKAETTKAETTKAETTKERATRSKLGRRGVTLAVGVAAVLGLAACGSSGSSTASVSPGAQPASANSHSASDATVNAAPTSLGTVLTDDKGLTLYTLKSNGTPVPCTGACAAAWPPLVVPSGTTSVTGAPGVTGLGTVVKGGATHVTDAGAPLYTFKGDKAPGDTNGDGLASFGGVWHVVKTTAAPASAAAPVPATTPPTTSSSGGYGY